MNTIIFIYLVLAVGTMYASDKEKTYSPSNSQRALSPDGGRRGSLPPDGASVIILAARRGSIPGHQYSAESTGKQQGEVDRETDAPAGESDGDVTEDVSLESPRFACRDVSKNVGGIGAAGARTDVSNGNDSKNGSPDHKQEKNGGASSHHDSPKDKATKKSPARNKSGWFCCTTPPRRISPQKELSASQLINGKHNVEGGGYGSNHNSHEDPDSD